MALTAAAALAALILHATILWTDPIERGIAAVAAALAFRPWCWRPGMGPSGPPPYWSCVNRATTGR